jgi:TolB protein
MVRFSPSLFAAILLLSTTAAAQTDIYLRTERAGRGKVPIVVEQIEAASTAERDAARYLTAVIRDDLTYSGLFLVVKPEERRDTLEAVSAAGALFEGTLGLDGGEFALDAKLLDFTSREVIFSKRYRFGDDARRRVAHTVSDEIVYFLVGERGIATTRLLFCRREGADKNIFLIDYDGFGMRQLTRGELAVSPLWLDGSRFCYTSYKRGNPDCYLIDLTAGKKFLLSQREGMNLAGSYYAPRDELAVTLSVKGDQEIYLMDSSGTIIRRLTRNRAIDVSPSWSPNGAEIAFVSDRTGVPQIYVMDAYGGNVRRLTGGSYDTSPVWSPRGDLIAYSSRDGGLYRLKLVSPDGLVEETVTTDDYSYEDPTWAPDGRHVAATVRYGGQPWIVVVDVDTGEKRKIVPGESPDWSPLSPASGSTASSR